MTPLLAKTQKIQRSNRAALLGAMLTALVFWGAPLSSPLFAQLGTGPGFVSPVDMAGEADDALVGVDIVRADTVYVQAVCIFDIDNTLTHGEKATQSVCPDTIFDNDPPPNWPKNSGTNHWVKRAIQTCVAKGYNLAIATAESGKEAGSGGAPNPIQRKFVTSLAPDLFTPSFFESAAFQTACGVVKSEVDGTKWCLDHEYGRKEMMMIEIMNYYNIIPTRWKYSIMFDDELKNLTAASQLGLKTVQSSPNCAGVYCDTGCGIMEAGLQAITDRPAVADLQE